MLHVKDTALPCTSVHIIKTQPRMYLQQPHSIQPTSRLHAQCGRPYPDHVYASRPLFELVAVRGMTFRMLVFLARAF